MNFGCTSNKKRRLKDENKNPSKMVPANKLKRKADFKLSESLNTNTESSYPNSRNRKKVLTPLDLSEGDKVFVKSNDRSFHEASFVKKSADHFIIKLKNGDDIRVEGTKLRLISQPSRSKTPNDEPTLEESLTSSSPISIRKTRASTKKVQTNDKIQKKHSQLDQEDSLTTLDKPVIYERDSVVTPALIEQSNDLTGSNEDFSCPSVKDYDLSNINNQSENEKSISEPNEEMDAAPGEEQHVSDAVNCACGIHDDQQEMVKCIQCMKMQHVNCLNLGQGPHTCFNCSKELFKIDDVFYYNFFISQNGMFPDPVLNKYCGISTEHASLFRSISQCIEKLESNLEITDDIGDLERRLSEVFSFPTLAQIDEIIPTENNAQLHKYLKTYFIENS